MRRERAGPGETGTPDGPVIGNGGRVGDTLLGLTTLFPEESRARARRDRWLTVLFGVLSIVLVARAAHKAGGVLARNQQWGARFLARQDPYFDAARGARAHGPYPPSIAWMAAPLASLPAPAARVLWAMLQMAVLGLFLRLLARRTEELWPTLSPHAPLVFALAVLLVSRYLLRDAAGGGGNMIHGYLAFLGVDSVLRGRALGGIPLAASLVLKPNLVPLVLFLSLRRRWRAVLVTLGVGAFLFVLPGLYYGLTDYARLASRWGRDVVDYLLLDDLHSRAIVPEGLPPAEDGMNQCLREAVHRCLRPPGDSGAADVHVLEVSPRAASWIARALSLALVLIVSATARAARDRRQEWLAGLAFLPLALLCSPVTWKAHHVVLLPVFYALSCLAFEPGGRARWLRWFLSGYWFTCDLLSREVIGGPARDLLQAMSLVTWADIALLSVVARLVLAER